MWNTSPARQVTSADFLREFKWMCNPSLGVGNPLYYVPVIKGMSSYCAAFAKVKPTASAMTSFTNSHSISGIKTPNSLTIQFNLVQPANDFLNILAMPFASARPVGVRQATCRTARRSGSTRCLTARTRSPSTSRTRRSC